jgi:hypothetical protein
MLLAASDGIIMSTSKRVVIGIVDTPNHADMTVRLLVERGFRPQDISTLYPDRHGEHDFAFEAKTKLPEGALMGIGLGAVMGATLGIALGLAGAIPALAMLVQSGPLITALCGAAIGAFAFGIIGAILGYTVPEIEAKHYEGKVTIGTILIGVHTDSRAEAKLARTIFRAVAASDVHTMTESTLPITARA